MKQLFSVLLIALLLVFPVLTAQADGGQYVYLDEELGILFTDDDLYTLNARAAEIAETHGVGVYYFYYKSVEDLPSFTEDFAAEHVVEDNALVFGLCTDYFYFLQIGPIAEKALNDDVCNGPIMDAYRSVTGDAPRKLMAYLNAADDAIRAYENNVTAATATGEQDTASVPDHIALTAGGKPTLVDHARLLTDSQAEALSKRLLEIGDAYRCDVVIVTVPDLGGKTSEAYADDYFDYNGYGYGATPDANGTTINSDGVLLLLSMEDRDFAISTSGYGITAFTDYGIQTYLESEFLPYLRENDYNSGFSAFADACEFLLKTAREGIPYDYRRVYVEGWTDSQLLGYNDRAESAANMYGVGIYYLESSALADTDAFGRAFTARRLLDGNAIVLVKGASGYSLLTVGDTARAKFTDEKFAAVRETVEPLLGKDDARDAVTAYLDKCIEIVSDYAHVQTSGALDESDRRSADARLKQLCAEHGIALYFLYDQSAADPQALVRDFLSSGAVYESDAVVLGANASGSAVSVKGSYASEKFTEKRIKKLRKEVDAYLPEGNVEGAVNAFAERSEKILTWRPVNWLTFAISVIAGLLFGSVPANGLKRQLTSVSKQTNAERYMEPSSFVMTQNANVLLGKSTSRSVHVVRTESSGGGRSGGGGSSFHGGSSTHTSSSGGTHGGHSGKF